MRDPICALVASGVSTVAELDAGEYAGPREEKPGAYTFSMFSGIYQWYPGLGALALRYIGLDRPFRAYREAVGFVRRCMEEWPKAQTLIKTGTNGRIIDADLYGALASQFEVYVQEKVSENGR